MFVLRDCCMLLGRGLCDELITRPEESYRLWCVVVCDLETSWIRRAWFTLGRNATKESWFYWLNKSMLLLFVSFKCSGFSWFIFCYTNYDALHQLNRHNWHLTQCSLWSLFNKNHTKWQGYINSKQICANPARSKNCDRPLHSSCFKAFSAAQWRTEGEGVFGGFKPPPPKFWRSSKIVSNTSRLRTIAEFRPPKLQDFRKRGSKILKLPSVRNCFTLAMTSKLVVIINSLKVPKIKKILLYEMKFLVYQITAKSTTPD